MDTTDDLWTAIRDVLPGAEDLAAAVAKELGEPLDDVRLSVLIGMIALHGQLGPADAATAAIRRSSFASRLCRASPDRAGASASIRWKRLPGRHPRARE